jgi:hypothetical protein
MTESYIQLPTDGTGKKTRNNLVSMSGHDVYEQIILISEHTQAMENNASGQPVYLGEAIPGTAKDVTGWRIKKIVYDENNFVTDIQWADGTAEFDKTWDSRDTYTYS